MLFATLPAYGHAAPLCSIAAELSARGHEVAWVAHPELGDRLLPRGATRFEVGGPGSEAATPRGAGRTALRQYFQEVLPRAAEAMVPAVRRAIREFGPQVVVVEQNCLAGSIGARLEGVRWACVHVTPILLLRPFRALPMIESWLDQQVGHVQRAHGVEPLGWPLRSPDGTLVASSREFLGEGADLREGDALVGALVEHRGDGDPAPFLGARPRILVSLGTVIGDAGERFLERAREGLEGLGSAVVAEPGRWLPQLALMPHLDAVLCHGGQGTVHEALLYGVPLVVAPVQFDQPAVAARVEALGAGRVISYEHAAAEQIREAVAAVLDDPGYAERARAVGATLGPGAARAADLVAALG